MISLFVLSIQELKEYEDKRSSCGNLCFSFKYACTFLHVLYI